MWKSGSARWVTTLRYTAVSLFSALVILMAYGLYQFPAAPIRFVNGQYEDNVGRIHSKADYNGFRLWERVLFASGFASVVTAIAYQYARRRR